jgi:hypothetical protein
MWNVDKEAQMNVFRFPCPWLAIVLFGFATQAHPAYSLTGIYDFRPLVTGRPDLFTPEQRQYPALVYEFEGLAFTQDGSLWASIAADPGGASRELWKLDLQNKQKTQSILDPVWSFEVQTPLGPLTYSIANPVGLAAHGDQLIVGENFQRARDLVNSSGGLAQATIHDVIWGITPGNSTPDWSFPLNTSACDEIEGMAYSGGKLYATCQNDKKVLEINPATGAVSNTFPFADQVLGLAETDDGRLIVGAYPSRELILFDPAGLRPSETISLNDLFFGPGSDYHALTGEVYSVQVVASEAARTRPDPDGLAYRNGKIYMSFDGDLRIYEISAVPEPETYAMMLAGLALVVAVAWRRKQAEV